MIGIIDYGMGNLRSVVKAFEREGCGARVLGGADEADEVEKLVLPGVGAFGDGMTHLRERGWVDAIGSFVDSGRLFLGICLGLQLLFDGSEEDAGEDGELVPGLGILGGKVVRFRQAVGGERFKIPHMGWNTLAWEVDDPLFRGLEQGCAVYFVHSYYAMPDDEGIVGAWTEYGGGKVCATVRRENVYAAQFHPEKSQGVGLRILKNFAEL